MYGNGSYQKNRRTEPPDLGSFPPRERYLLHPYMMENAALAKMAECVIARGTRLSTPIMVGWIVSTKCQLQCKHCWARHNDEPQPSPLTREKIAKRLAESEICRVILSGGEPTLVPELGEYIRILKKAGKSVCIYTNAMDPTGRARGSTWLDFWDHDLDYVQVSLDGGNCTDFEAQRGEKTFSHFLKGVEFLRQNGVRLLAHYIATPFNGADVYGAARLALQLGFEGFIAEMFYPRGRAALISLEDTISTSLAFNTSVTAMLVDTKLMGGPLQIGICFPIAVPFPSFVRDMLFKQEIELRWPLKIGTDSCVVTASGDVFPDSFLDSDSAYFCGSLMRESLVDIWRNGPGFQQIPRVRDLSHALCATCTDCAFCKGGLAERAFERFGTFNAHDPLCHFCRDKREKN